MKHRTATPTVTAAEHGYLADDYARELREGLPALWHGACRVVELTRGASLLDVPPVVVMHSLDGRAPRHGKRARLVLVKPS